MRELASRARIALRDAAERAAGLNSFASASRFYRAALELWPESEPDRSALVFRLAQALWYGETAGYDEAVHAAEGLSAAGDSATAAEAEVLAAEIAWWSANADRAAEHLRVAARLADGLAPSYAKAYVVVQLSRFAMLRGEQEQIGRAHV